MKKNNYLVVTDLNEMVNYLITITGITDIDSIHQAVISEASPALKDMLGEVSHFEFSNFADLMIAYARHSLKVVQVDTDDTLTLGSGFVLINDQGTTALISPTDSIVDLVADAINTGLIPELNSDSLLQYVTELQSLKDGLDNNARVVNNAILINFLESMNLKLISI